jgi:hypothetical protein
MVPRLLNVDRQEYSLLKGQITKGMTRRDDVNKHFHENSQMLLFSFDT